MAYFARNQISFQMTWLWKNKNDKGHDVVVTVPVAVPSSRYLNLSKWYDHCSLLTSNGGPSSQQDVAEGVGKNYVSG
jgi:hypothetical protein